MADKSAETSSKRGTIEKPVQERLGRELRVAYGTIEAKPAFLGDPALPPQFDEPVRRLHRAQKAHATGVAAVERALSGLGSDADEPPAPPRHEKR
ncbi:hypothetical protein [Salinarimonas soli]|uniref:Uncharacterized protein n=1 Tax=Salinarimonas soli TaxID=1638099 RepID=A0A5B2W178_9HYPH|nr:hypothetical protein [Salinarimonas soli]KAA2244207.1 hypothetical protein F0L46_00735 [Salinarimonas soli]